MIKYVFKKDSRTAAKLFSRGDSIEKIQNDNSAFWDKNRKNWLHILTDDYAENYNRTPVYPEISEQYKAKMHEKKALKKEAQKEKLKQKLNELEKGD